MGLSLHVPWCDHPSKGGVMDTSNNAVKFTLFLHVVLKMVVAGRWWGKVDTLRVKTLAGELQVLVPFCPILGLLSAVYSIHLVNVTSNNMLYTELNCIQNWPPQEEKCTFYTILSRCCQLPLRFRLRVPSKLTPHPPTHTHSIKQHVCTHANVRMERDRRKQTLLNRELTFFHLGWTW